MLRDPELNDAYQQLHLFLPPSGRLDTKDSRIILSLLLALRAIDRLNARIHGLAADLTNRV